MIARLPGLFRSERLASDMSAVTRVIVILIHNKTLIIFYWKVNYNKKQQRRQASTKHYIHKYKETMKKEQAASKCISESNS